MTMPSGRVITTAFDNMDRPTGVSGQFGTAPAVPYASSVTYGPQGAVTQINLNNGLIEQTCYNNMLQPVVIRQRQGSAAACSAGEIGEKSGQPELRSVSGTLRIPELFRWRVTGSGEDSGREAGKRQR